MRRAFLLGVILLSLVNYSNAFSCQGTGINWKNSTYLAAPCGQVQSCVPFTNSELTITGDEIKMQRCYTNTYTSKLLSNKLVKDDLFLYNTFLTVPGVVYTISFDWDGIVISNDCNTSRTDVLAVTIYNGTFNDELKNTNFYCEGTICMGNSTGYRRDNTTFTASSNRTTIVFRTATNRAVRVNLKNIIINSTNLPCQDTCGGDPRCNYFAPDKTTNTCNLNNTKFYFEDVCNINCQVVELTNVCRSSIYKPTCNASALCEAIAPNTCFGSELCYSDCGYYNVNTKQEYCAACGYTWAGNTCCGDKAGESYKNCSLQGGSCSGAACCNTTTSCVWLNICYADGSRITPLSSICGSTLTCNSGTWIPTPNQTACLPCGAWVGDACCYQGVSYNFTEGGCVNGEVITCSSDDKCASDYNIICAARDPDCTEFSLSLSEAFLGDNNQLMFELGVTSPLTADLIINYTLMRGGLVIIANSTLKSGVYGRFIINESLLLEQTPEPGGYYLNAETIFNGTYYSTGLNFSLLNNCVDLSSPKTIVLIVDNRTIDDQLIFELPANKTVSFKLDNNCNQSLNNVNTEFMNDTFYINSIVLSNNINLRPVINSMANETTPLIIRYDGGYTVININVIKLLNESAAQSADSELTRAKLMLEEVGLKAPFALLTAEQYYADLSKSQELIDLAELSLNNLDYGMTIVYASNAATLLEAINTTLTLPIMLSIAILFTGASTILFAFVYWYKLRVKSKKK